MDKIEYWFDQKKLGNSTDTTSVKEKFKQIMYNGESLTNKGTLIFESIWGNFELKRILFENRLESAAKLCFQNTIIKDISNAFYNFIKIK